LLHFKKDPIVEQDLVLIHIENKPVFYGRVEQITADVKPKWWQVKFLFLTLPYQVTTWIIDEEQIRGADFTMGGTPIRIEKLVVPEDQLADENEEVEEPKLTRKASVLSLKKDAGDSDS